MNAVLALALMACGGPTARSDAGGDSSAHASDAGSSTDSGANTLDAGPGTDAASPSDAGQDASSPPVDGDEDGIPEDLDCDDTDPAVGASAVMDCTNACGPGTSSCADGTWAACTAPTECLCSTPGMTRIVSCGNCGEQAQRCGDAGSWEDTSACLNQGPCVAGEVETMVNEYCEERQRICQLDCEWGSWSVTVPAGECQRGTSDCTISCSFGSRGYTCDDMCRLGPQPEHCPVQCD